MITYTHYGKQPDVLKHLILCEAIQFEKPQVYVETDSACAIDRNKLNKYISERFEKEGINDYTTSELIMNTIREDSVVSNPGILGSGILATNLSQQSNSMILSYSKN